MSRRRYGRIPTASTTSELPKFTQPRPMPVFSSCVPVSAFSNQGNSAAAGFGQAVVNVQPALSAQLLIALKAGDRSRAESIRSQFSALEDLRNGHGPIPVLHHAVAGAGIAKTGPHLPLLGPLADPIVAEVASAALALRNLPVEV